MSKSKFRRLGTTVAMLIGKVFLRVFFEEIVKAGIGYFLR